VGSWDTSSQITTVPGSNTVPSMAKRAIVVADRPTARSCSTAWLVLAIATTGTPAPAKTAAAVASVVVLPCPAGAISVRSAGPGPHRIRTASA
jgi:hypothetical protein